MKGNIPLWLKTSYTLLVLIIIPVYWYELGPTNFLWFSDIALISLVAAVWLEKPLISSTMAVAVFLLESLWVFDFLSGATLIQISAYMFDAETKMQIRILSGIFHLALPPLLLYLLIRLGYDSRALFVQIIIALIVLPLSYLLTQPEDNINWVYGAPGLALQLPALHYLALLATTLIICCYIPSHLVFKHFFSIEKEVKKKTRNSVSD